MEDSLKNYGDCFALLCQTSHRSCSRGSPGGWHSLYIYTYNLSTIAKIQKEEKKLKKFELKIKHIKKKITKWVDTLWCIFEKDEKKGKIEVKGPKKAQFYNVFGERKIHIKIGMIDL